MIFRNWLDEYADERTASFPPGSKFEIGYSDPTLHSLTAIVLGSPIFGQGVVYLCDDPQL